MRVRFFYEDDVLMVDLMAPGLQKRRPACQEDVLAWDNAFAASELKLPKKPLPKRPISERAKAKL